MCVRTLFKKVLGDRRNLVDGASRAGGIEFDSRLRQVNVCFGTVSSEHLHKHLCCMYLLMLRIILSTVEILVRRSMSKDVNYDTKF